MFHVLVYYFIIKCMFCLHVILPLCVCLACIEGGHLVGNKELHMNLQELAFGDGGQRPLEEGKCRFP